MIGLFLKIFKILPSRGILSFLDYLLCVKTQDFLIKNHGNTVTLLSSGFSKSS